MTTQNSIIFFVLYLYLGIRTRTIIRTREIDYLIDHDKQEMVILVFEDERCKMDMLIERGRSSLRRIDEQQLTASDLRYVKKLAIKG